MTRLLGQLIHVLGSLGQSLGNQGELGQYSQKLPLVQHQHLGLHVGDAGKPAGNGQEHLELPHSGAFTHHLERLHLPDQPDSPVPRPLPHRRVRPAPVEAGQAGIGVPHLPGDQKIDPLRIVRFQVADGPFLQKIRLQVGDDEGNKVRIIVDLKKIQFTMAAPVHPAQELGPHAHRQLGQQALEVATAAAGYPARLIQVLRLDMPPYPPVVLVSQLHSF
mmetsp:Transcript_105043/g.240679  ORF Transcript_105043/g.240679 Transcript_105043/m.240679 type:complete len:219 (+) Transcript_105043:539-1195(+)